MTTNKKFKKNDKILYKQKVYNYLYAKNMFNKLFY